MYYRGPQIDGECFLELSESEVKELVKPLRIVKKILRILQKVFFLMVCISRCRMQ